MEIVASGMLSRAEPGTRRAALTFPCMIALASGLMLATLPVIGQAIVCRAGEVGPGIQGEYQVESGRNICPSHARHAGLPLDQGATTFVAINPR